jgi:hypothetical protein
MKKFLYFVLNNIDNSNYSSEYKKLHSFNKIKQEYPIEKLYEFPIEIKYFLSPQPIPHQSPIISLNILYIEPKDIKIDKSYEIIYPITLTQFSPVFQIKFGSKKQSSKILIKELEFIKEKQKNIFNYYLTTFENNYELLDKYLTQKYKSYIREIIEHNEKKQKVYPLYYRKLVDTYDKKMLSQLFTLENTIKIPLIDARYSLKDIDLESFKRFYDVIDYEKDLKKYEEEDNPKKFGLVRYLIEDTDKGLSKYLKKLYPKKNISNAFTKSWEIYETFPFKFKKEKNFKTFHFCELPGNFINSLMNYAKQDVDFMAESLNPKHPKNIEKYGNEIFSDQYGLVKKYPKRWNFGIPPNDTGDILDTKLLQYYRDINKTRKPILITSDAGLNDEGLGLFDLQKLDVGQAIAVISSTVSGTDVIVKHFTPYINIYKESREGIKYFLSYIELYRKYFERVYFFKPFSSNKGSGEFYIVALNSKTMPDKEFQHYCNKLNNFKLNEPIGGYSPITIMQTYSFMEKLIVDNNLRRVKLMNYFITFIDEVSKNRNRIDEIKIEKYKEWIKEFNFLN